MIEGVTVLLPGHGKQEQKEGEAGDHMFMEGVQRIPEEMAEGDDDQDAPQRQEGPIHPPSQEQEGPGDEFDEGDRHPHGPERPHGEKGVLVGQEEQTSVAYRGERENLVHPGHEEDESQHQPRKQLGPGS